MKVSKSIKSNLFLLAAAAIWGFAFVAQCDAADKINTYLLIFVRYVLGSAALLPVIFIFESPSEVKNNNKPPLKLTWGYGAISGTILFIASALQQWGIYLDPNAGKAGFITGTYTVLVPIVYLLFFKKKTGINVLIGAVFAVIGLYLLSVQNGFSNISLSDIVLFIGAIFWTFHIISIDRFVGKVSPIKFSSVQFLVCGIWGLLFTLVLGEISISTAISQIGSSLGAILYMGICSSGVAYTCQVLGQRDADPTYSAIILSLESVFAAVGGVIFGIDDAMTPRAYIGCAVIFIGILISQISFDKFKIKKQNS